MHYDWFALACLEAFGTQTDAIASATFSQLVDDATHENLAPRMMGTSLPPITQGEIDDVAYAALSGGMHCDYERIAVFHFPWGPYCDGICEKGVVDESLKLAANKLKFLSCADSSQWDIRQAQELARAKVGLLAHSALDANAAHFDFSGLPSKMNARPAKDRKWWAVLPAILPDKMAIGHSEYGALPDTIGAVWYRNGQTRDNRRIYFRAAARMWNCLRPDQAVEVDLKTWNIVSRSRTRIPECVNIMAGVAANKDATLRAEIQKAWLAKAGAPMPPYEIPDWDVSAWSAFRTVAMDRLREVLL
jgi:hypothetical protein